MVEEISELVLRAETAGMNEEGVNEVHSLACNGQIDRAEEIVSEAEKNTQLV